MKKHIFIPFVISLAFIACANLSSSDLQSALNTPSSMSVKIPKNATQIAEDVFSLGEKEIDGKKVEGYMIINYKKEKAKNTQQNFAKVAVTEQCYSFLAKDAKWKSSEPWIINGTNSRGLAAEYLFNNSNMNINKWETASTKNIFGEGSLTTDILSMDTSSPDGQNEIYFGEIDSIGAIAVTTVWGIFSGPPKNRVLVEWDQVYDQVDFDWSDKGEPGKMDFENISTHEVGHAFGMGHPSDSCVNETMYRFASEGETKKRILNNGDIFGIKKLYQ